MSKIAYSLSSFLTLKWSLLKKIPKLSDTQISFSPIDFIFTYNQLLTYLEEMNEEFSFLL